MRTPLIYDGYDLSRFLHIESAPRRPLLADNEISQVSFSGRDGSDFESSHLSSFEIEIDVRLISEDVSKDGRHRELKDLRREIAGLLYRKKPCPLVIPTEPDVYYMAMIDGSTDLNTLSYTASTTLIFRVFESAGYGKKHKKSSEGGQLNFVVNGNYPTIPEITVKAKEPFVMDIDGSVFMVLGTPSGSCKISGNKIYDASGSLIRFSLLCKAPKFDPGRHSVSCEHPFEVEWQERWL